FFQAEDGIRDFHVTGVQTCALPIYSSPSAETTKRKRGSAHNGWRRCGATTVTATTPCKRSPHNSRTPCSECASPVWGCSWPPARSEERRVGKECSAGWTTEH